MNTNKMANWLQIGGNLGIILGLVLVGLQLKQNSDLLRVQLLYEESQSFIAHERVMIGEYGSAVWAKSMEAPKDLTLTESRIIEAYLYAMAEQWRASHLLHELGLLGEEWKDRLVDEVPYYLGNPYGRAWWKVYREDTSLPPDIVTLVEQSLIENPNFTLQYHDRLKKELPALIE